MGDQYRKMLEKKIGQDVIINRDGTSDLKGVVDSTDDDGCSIKVKKEGRADSCIIFFVAYKDIRGVGSIEHDYDVI